MADGAPSTPSATQPDFPAPKSLRVLLLLLASYLIIVVAFCMGDLVEQIVLNGLSFGLSRAMARWPSYFYLCGRTWPIFILPLNLLGLLLYCFFPRPKLLKFFVLGPTVALVIFTSGLFLMYFPSREKQFKSETGIPLPVSARDLHAQFINRRFFGVTSATVFFRCDLHDAQGFVASAQLQEVPVTPDFVQKLAKFSLPGCPDLATWSGLHIYSRDNSDEEFYLHMVTDETKTQVYILSRSGE